MGNAFKTLRCVRKAVWRHLPRAGSISLQALLPNASQSQVSRGGQEARITPRQ